MMGRPGQDTVRQEQLRPHREQRIGGGWWAIGGPCTSMACPLVLPREAWPINSTLAGH